MSPAEACVGLKGVLTLCAILFDCSEQWGYNLRQTRRGCGRRGSRRPLGAIRGYLSVGSRSEGEALGCR
jgi:hypothetical protein